MLPQPREGCDILYLLAFQSLLEPQPASAPVAVEKVFAERSFLMLKKESPLFLLSQSARLTTNNENEEQQQHEINSADSNVDRVVDGDERRRGGGSSGEVADNDLGGVARRSLGVISMVKTMEITVECR